MTRVVLACAVVACAALFATNAAAGVGALMCAVPLSAAAKNGSATPERRDDDAESDNDDNHPDPAGSGDEHRDRRLRARLFSSLRLQDRLKLLTHLGLTDGEIAHVIPDGGSARSVRRWRRDGVTAAREAALWHPIDDVCAIISYLLADGTYDERAAIAWLRSRHPDLAQRRPLNVLRAGDFDAVLHAAEMSLGAVAIPDARTLWPSPKATKRVDQDDNDQVTRKEAEPAQR